MGLAMAGFEPKFPEPGSGDIGLVIRPRIVRADPGKKLLRWLVLFAGAAVCEAHLEVSGTGEPPYQAQAVGKRRWAMYGGNSESMLIDAAKIAGERAARAIENSVGTPV